MSTIDGPSEKRLAADPDGQDILGYTFKEEPVGMPANAGFGYARLEFGDTIGPEKQYTILRKLGWGKTSSTWLAVDNTYDDNFHTCEYPPSDPEHFAIKVFTGHATSLFEKGIDVSEPHTLRALSNDSDHCPKLSEEFSMPGLGSAGEHHCLVTHLYGDIKTLQNHHGQRFPLPLAKRILRHLLRGITHSHSCGIVHTDIKPDNVFYDIHPLDITEWLPEDPPRRNAEEISVDGIVQSAISQPFPAISIGEALLSYRTFVLGKFESALPLVACAQGLVVSSPAYRAPEVYLGGQWDEKVDIWSFGCLVYELVTREELFRYVPNNALNLTETENILHRMISYCGSFRAAQLNASPLADELFMANGLLKKNPEVTDLPFETLIGQHGIMPDVECMAMAKFMRRCLRLDPKDRANAQHLLQDPWLQETDRIADLSE